MPPADCRRGVFLVGFMGAGKTSVGRNLGRLLGWKFEDLDDRIQDATGRPVAEIFRDSGEPEFRRLENVALRQLLGELTAGPRVVALGGGAFAQAENVALLESSGAYVIFLDGSAEELFRRCELEHRERPLLRDAKSFRELYEQRRPSYLKASCRIDTTSTDVDGIAAAVARRIGVK
ncbi:MAG: shikimate kinase [Terriglobales bacterium]